MKNFFKFPTSFHSIHPLIPLTTISAALILSLIKYDILSHYDSTSKNVVISYHLIRTTLLFASISFAINIKSLPQNTFNTKNIPIDNNEIIRKAYDPLLGIRALAFFSVFFGHWFLVVFPPIDILNPSSHFYFRALISSSPWGGVWIFFTLSGYLMGKGFLSERYNLCAKSLSIFYKNRALRIIPLYFFTVFLVAVIQKPDFLFPHTAEQLDTLLSEFLFDSQSKGAIGAIWSISTEMQFYIAIPFIHLIFSHYFLKPSLRYIIISFTFLIIVFSKIYSMQYYGSFWHEHIYFPTLSNMDCFLSGYLTSMIVTDFKKKSISFKYGIEIGTIAGLCFLSILSIHSYIYMVQNTYNLRPLFLGLYPALTAISTSLVILLFELSVRQEPKSSIPLKLFWNTQSLLGSLTYSLYIWHEPILLSMRKAFKSSLQISDSIKYLPFGFLFCFIISYILYTSLELYFDKMRTTFPNKA